MAEHKKCSLASILIVFLFSSLHVAAQNSTTFLYSGGVQYYVAPIGIDTVHIECWGAQGGKSAPTGNNQGGRGAYTSGIFAVTPGDTLVIIVGGKGFNGTGNASNIGGGGGGGSFVIHNNGYIPMIIAAGGGGGSFQNNATGQPGQADVNAGGGAYNTVTVGQGGYTDNGVSGGNGGGGGGWFSDGAGNNWCTPAGMQGGNGGTSFAGPGQNGDGGYGGGGAAYNGGGGGGGYTGGGGGGWSTGGGGGGSYNTGLNQLNLADVKPGSGQVIITTDCIPMTSVYPDLILCEGDEIILNVNSNQGGNVTWSNGVLNNVPFAPSVGTHAFVASSDIPSDCPYVYNVQVNPLPNVVAHADTTQVCYESIPVTLTGSGAATYTWSNGVLDGVPFEPPIGETIYMVTGTDSAGCQNFDSVSIFNSNPWPTFIVSNEILGNDGAIDMSVSGGVAPYIFDWSNDGFGDWDDPEDLNGLTEGLYTVYILDSMGCTSVAQEWVFSYVSLTNETKDFFVYPNPAQEFVSIEYPGNFRYAVVDLQGSIVTSGFAHEQVLVDLVALQPGNYIIVIETNSGIDLSRFVKD